MTRVGRAIWRVLAGALLLLALIPIIVLGLGATETGSRWIVNAATGLTETAQIGRVEGRLLSAIVLYDMALELPSLSATVERAEFRWQPYELVNGELHIERAAVAGVDAEIMPSAPAEQTELPQRLPIPVDVALDELEVSNVRIRIGEDEHVLERAALAASASATLLEITRFHAEYGPLTVDGEGELTPSAPYPGTFALHWQARVPTLGVARGDGRIEGDQNTLQVQHTLRAPFEIDSDVELTLTQTPPAVSANGTWRDVRWPVVVTPAYRSDRGSYRIDGSLDDFNAAFEADIEVPDLPYSELSVAAKGALDEQVPHAFDLALEWSLNGVDVDPVTASATLSGDTSAIAFEHRLQTPFAINTAGSVALDTPSPHVEVEGTWEGLQWPLKGAPEYESPSGQYHVTGTVEAFEASIEAGVTAQAVPIRDIALSLSGGAEPAPPHAFETALAWTMHYGDGEQFSGNGKASGSVDAVSFTHRLAGPLALETNGDVTLTTPVGFDIAGTWESLRWPLLGEPKYRSPRGRYQVDGTLDAYRARIDAETQIEGAPPATIDLALSGDMSKALIEPLRIEGLGGELEVRGPINWSSGLTADLALSAKNIDPGEHWPGLDGALGLDAHIAGAITHDIPSFLVEVERLDGELRGYPVDASGTVQLDGTHLDAKGITLRSGSNRLTLEGRVGDTLGADFTLDGPALNQLWPGLRGTLSGAGSLSGARNNPRIKATLGGRGIAYEDTLLGALDANLDIDQAAPERSSARVTLTDLQAGGITASQIELFGDGNLERHKLSARLHSDLGALQLTLSGRVVDETWTARLASLDIDNRDLGRWVLAGPVAVSANAKRASAERACLVQGTAELCAGGSWDSATGVDVVANAARIPLSLARTVLPGSVSLDGRLDGRFEAKGAAPALKARFEVQPQPGVLTFTGSDGEPLTIAYRDAEIVGIYGVDGVASTRFGLALESNGIAKGVLRAAPNAAGAFDLEGGIEANFPDLSLVEAFVPQLSSVKGGLTLGVSIAGTSDAPVLNGEAEVKDASAAVPELGVQLEGLNLRAQSDAGKRLVLAGEVRSGDGRLNLEGDVALDPDAGWPTKIRVAGENFQAAKLPEAQVLISPKLNIEAAESGITVDGVVAIPRAALQINELPEGSVQVSSDEIIIGESDSTQVEAPAAGPPLTARLRVTLGDDVTFEGFSLSTGLEGELELVSKPREPPSAQGTLALRDGEYTGYGQQLSIERGRFLFSGAVDNPGLDLRATRTSGSVKAGIEVFGTAKQPRSRVFSEPALPDAQALSYLLTGRSLSEGGGAGPNSQMIGQAAIALGVKDASSLVQQLGQSVGIDELSVDPSSLALGKYLTPDLYIRYAFGLFDSTGVAELSYRLTDSLKLQGRAGINQSVDLIYQIERDKVLF